MLGAVAKPQPCPTAAVTGIGRVPDPTIAAPNYPSLTTPSFTTPALLPQLNYPSFTAQRANIATLLDCYTARLLHCYSVTLLQCYTALLLCRLNPI